MALIACGNAGVRAGEDNAGALGSGTDTVRVQVLGSHGPNATDSYVTLDALFCE